MKITNIISFGTVGTLVMLVHFVLIISLFCLVQNNYYTTDSGYTIDIYCAPSPCCTFVICFVMKEIMLSHSHENQSVVLNYLIFKYW